MTCKIDSLVTERVASLDESCLVQEAAELMARDNLGSLVVTDGGKLSGMFTERDLLRRVVGEARDPRQVRLAEVCTRNLVAIDRQGSCEEAIRLMQSNRCRRLVVNWGDTFFGLVTMRDVAEAMASQGGRKDIVVNVFGAVTLAVALGVIVMLFLQLPDMLQLVERVSSR